MKTEKTLLSFLATPLTWPLKKAMTYTLEHPALIQYATVTVSRFPFLFNRLLSFAQAHGIVMAPEEGGFEQNRINAEAELTPSARIIFDALQKAFEDKRRKPASCE